jgi:uncharacterized membrane protein
VITDIRVERAISILLISGVLLAAAVVLFGGILYLAHQGGEHPDYHVFRGVSSDLRAPGMVVRNAFAGRPDAIIQLGLLLLILTPVSRVLFSVIAFASEHDYMYVAITLIVLAVLLYSLLEA